MPTEPRVVILVPRRAGVADRDRLWAFTREWWERDHPDWPIVEGHHTEGLFNRSLAVNAAATSAGRWDVAVIIDSDVLCNKRAVETAVDMARAMKVMVVAFHQRLHLNKDTTARVLGGFRGSWESAGMIERVYDDQWSSCVVVPRTLWDDVGGFDPQFVGWGYEDDAFRWACETIADKPMLRVSGKLWHLWHEASKDPPSAKLANKERAAEYRAALHNIPAMRALIADAHAPPPVIELGPTRIPRILHRTVPEAIDAECEGWWERFRELHPGWELMTHRDPLDVMEWPELGDLWEVCQNGAQKAGLIRLEALWRWGGVYVDSDVEPYRSLEPLLHVPGFAAWEDAKVVPDAVLGAEPAHPAVGVMIRRARLAIESGADAWHSGPGVTTRTLPGRADWLLLPPGSLYPYSYRERSRRHNDHMTEQPWAFAAHHWAGSWLTREQKRQLRTNQVKPNVFRR